MSLFVIIIYFKHKEWEKVEKWEENLSSNTNKKIRADIKVIASYFKIIAFYERNKNLERKTKDGWDDKMIKLTEVLKYYIEASKFKHLLNNDSIKFLKKLSSESEKDEKKILTSYKKSLETYLDKQAFYDPFTLILDWVDYRLNLTDI